MSKGLKDTLESYKYEIEFACSVADTDSDYPEIIEEALDRVDRQMPLTKTQVFRIKQLPKALTDICEEHDVYLFLDDDNIKLDLMYVYAGSDNQWKDRYDMDDADYETLSRIAETTARLVEIEKY